MQAGPQSGFGGSSDLNGFNPEGLARLDSTKWNRWRCSAAVAYLHPAAGRPNLTIQTGAVVQRVDIAGNRASGLTYSKGA